MKTLRPWILLFVVAFLLRLGMMFYWEHRVGTDQFYFGDSDTYWRLGKAIAAGEPYHYGGARIHRMPGCPVLLAPLFLFFGDPLPHWIARTENILIGCLTVLAVSWLAQTLFQDKKIALLAGWITALDPMNIVMSVLILSEAPFCLFMVLQLVFWIKALRSNETAVWSNIFLSGLAAAATVYCRPSWLYFVPFACLLGMLLSPRKFKPILISGTAITVVLAACLSPWWYRNYQITGHFVSTTLQTGPSLYDGLSPEATGASNMDFVETFRNAEFKLGSGEKDNTLEYRLNQKLRQAAINWAIKHPDKALKLARSKFVRLWNIWPNEATLSDWYAKAAVFCTYSPILVLGLLGVLRSFGRDFPVRLLWIPAVYITALHIVFVSSIRYRAPAMICFAVLAAWVLLDLLNSFSKKKAS